MFITKHNIVKNPKWPEANQLAIYKRWIKLWFSWTEYNTGQKAFIDIEAFEWENENSQSSTIF